MAGPRVLILRAAGTNCDLETEFAWVQAGATAERVHLRRVIESPALLQNCQIVTLPGGFSYGDDISAGRIFAAQLERHLADQLRLFVDRGGLILGICNGFQVLVKAGMLPRRRGDDGSAACTITRNRPAGFQDRWVRLRANDVESAFLDAGVEYEFPIAHGEGRVVFDSEQSRVRMTANGHALLRYVPAASGVGPETASNPNGSDADLAGFGDDTGRVFGLMPHPERFVTWTQHPCWTSLPPREPCDGLRFFRRAVAFLS